MPLRRKTAHGIATVVVLLVIGLVAMIASALVVMGSNNLIFSHAAGESLKAEMAAQAGLQHAARRLARDASFIGNFTGTTQTAATAMPGGGANYTVNVTTPTSTWPGLVAGVAPPPATLTVPASHFYILSRGTTDNGTVRFMGLLVSRSESIFPTAIFGGQEVEFKNNAKTDTWDSSVGPYAVSYDDGAGKAHVQTNNTSVDAIKFNGSGQKLDADSAAVPTGDILTPAGAPAYTGAGTIFRNQRTATPRPTPPVNMDGQDPDSASNPPDITGVVNLAPGTYKDVTIKAGGVLVLQEGTYYLKQLKVESGGIVELPLTATAPTKVKILDDLEMLDGSSINNVKQKPDMLRFEVKNGDVKVKGSDMAQSCYATIYAPTQEVKIEKQGGGEGHLFGALTGRKVILEEGCAVHYDKTLATESTTGAGTLKIVTYQRF